MTPKQEKAIKDRIDHDYALGAQSSAPDADDVRKHMANRIYGVLGTLLDMGESPELCKYAHDKMKSLYAMCES